MRSEGTMFSLITDCALKDPRVRLVLLSGSRVNPAAPRDDLQDFDIVYFVADLDSYRASEAWLDTFGSRMMMQKPEEMGANPPEKPDLAYLMLFEDGNRIELSLRPLSRIRETAEGEGFWRVLLDKDQLAASLPKPTAAQFQIQPPSAKTFEDCCNEFWWVSPYVAKGLCRQEQLYAVWHMEAAIRKELLKMLAWLVGLREGWQVQPGKQYKYLQAHLDPSDWKLLTTTCRLDKPANCWQALFAAQRLFRHASRQVGEQFGFAYPPYDGKLSPYIEALYQRWQDFSSRPR
ncbi:MAG TPA: aminoglycoside 6-adenylyltransferase [Anaerolineaceae bacterium]|nr:aminoglycoside 6-adenylyltransferase [Anaerolineaceae bacterium]HPS33258.1 aminoglycoside 6-adenylyltransferase [Anaerolineaceae bacterium]